MAAEKRYKIGEVCKLAELQPYVLRYWETEFPPLAPSKSGGGQRVYSQREIDIILRIKQLLYAEGFTIAGAKKKLEGELDDEGHLVAESDGDSAAATSGPLTPDARKLLAEAKRDLRSLLSMLKK